MSSKASYDPVGKASPECGDDSCSGGNRDSTSDAKGAKSVGDNSGGFTVTVRRMQRRNWIILAGAAVLVTLVIVVAIVLVTMQNDEDHGIKMYNTDAERSKHTKSGLVVERPAFCSEEPDPGMCRAYFEMYHYDPKSDSCKKFVYGGCDGNANRFKSLAECELDCFAGNKSSAVSNDIDEEVDHVVPDDKDPDVPSAKTNSKTSDEIGNSVSKFTE